MASPPTQENLKLRLLKTPVGDKLVLRRIQGEEGISELFHYTLEMVSSDHAIGFADVIDKPMTVIMQLEGGGERHVNGLVTRFVQAGNDGVVTTYLAELRPWTWLLTLASDCRIFQEQSVNEIVELLLKDLGFSAGKQFRWSLQGTYAKREYVVQYKETAYDFMCRLLEDAGIFFYFEHTADDHTLVFGDDPAAHKPVPGNAKAAIQQSQVERPAEHGIAECTIEERVVPKTYAMGDYDFTKPKTSLIVKSDGAAGRMKLFEYHGGYLEKGPGEKKAGRRLETFEWEQRVLSGSGSCRNFTAGHSFTLERHERGDVNGEYLLTWVSLSIDQRRYGNSFRAIPKKVPYRPPLRAPRPRMTGSETAVVVGKKGEEIWADAQGRIKVQFHWDRLGKSDENSSCWVRVAQPWAGTGWGSWFVPRLGMEVVVQYVDGDPDRPLVTGAVYNGEHQLPYDPSKQPTTSTIKSNSSKGGGGFNEIRLEDKKSSEEIYVHAQKNMTIMVRHDRVKTVENDETNTIKKNRTTTIQQEHEKLIVEKGNRTVLIKKGTETHHVEGTRGLTVKGNETHGNDANFTHNVKGNYVLKVKGNLTIEVTGNITIKGKTIASTAQMAMTNEALSISNKAKTSIKNEGLTLDNKGKVSIKNEALTLENKGSVMLKNESGVMISNKGGVMNKCEGGVMLMLKGAFVKIN